MKPHSRFWLLLCSIALLLTFTSLRAAAAPLSTIVVTNDLDDTTSGNGCSLREAITNSNNNAQTFSDCAAGVGLDNIVFDIPPDGLHTINVTGSQLPEITDPVNIDATTQPGCSCGPLIELNGSAAGANANGFQVSAGRTVIRGFVINQFLDNGIEMFNSGSNRIEGNYIGTDVSGTVARSNGINGIAIGSDNNIIGGTTSSARNLISGNAADGVAIGAGPNTGNIVEGNYIGADVYGTAALANGDNGVQISFGAHGNTIGGTTAAARNIISGNTQNGVQFVDQGTDGNFIINNYIGTDVSGKNPLANGNDGIFFGDGPDFNTIGGSSAAARNVISGNTKYGIELNGHLTQTNLVAANFIGTDVTGTAALSNLLSGIFITNSPQNAIGDGTPGGRNIISGNNADGITISGNLAQSTLIRNNYIGTDVSGMIALRNNQIGININGAPNTHIGTFHASEGNVISANALGILVSGANSVGTHITNNYIGTAADGISNLGNLNEGIFLNGAHDSSIGELKAGTGNVIAFNNTGIVVGSDSSDTSSLANQILGNSIHDNEVLGIDLGGTGMVLPNDANDPDTGPNKLQNFPVITAAQNTASNLHIEGRLNSATANSKYPVHIEFFSSPACSPSGFGEGQTILGTESLAAPGSFTANLKVNLAADSQLTATATDNDGNTSEFSKCVPIQASACVTAPDAPTLTKPGDGTLSKVRQVPLAWTSVNCATTYVMIIKEGSRVGKNVERQEGLTVPHTTTETLTRGKTFFWRVRACNDVGCGPWTAFSRFQVSRSANP